jgi:hypothetical protein
MPLRPRMSRSSASGGSDVSRPTLRMSLQGTAKLVEPEPIDAQWLTALV